MGWKEGATIGENTYWLPNATSRGILLPNFCNDWNAMKMLVEYARGRMPYVDILMSVHQVACSMGPTTGVAETAPLAVALAFLKCFGKEGE
jgi:hypothetical protein